MDNQKFNLILDRLLEKTQEGTLEWKATANEDTFLLVLKDSSISISQINDHIPNLDEDSRIYPRLYCYYKFDFRNENGETVASVNLTNSEADKKGVEKAEKIFELASQNSFLNNKTIDRILEQLAA